MSNPGFLFAEDAALKERLAAVAVSDNRNTERVSQVFYGYPDAETEKVYPFFTIDLLDVSFASDRQHSERQWYYTNDQALTPAQQEIYTSIDYYPSEKNASDMATAAGVDGFLSMDQFVAVDLLYQVTTYARNPIHDRQLHGLLLRRVFPMRRGFIEIPEDGTIRRCELLDWRSADYIDQDAGHKKRTFRKVYTVRINAEIPQSDLLEVKKVLSVQGLLQDNDLESTVLSTSFSEEF